MTPMPDDDLERTSDQQRDDWLADNCYPYARALALGLPDAVEAMDLHNESEDIHDE
jgi:hypothetical protein